MMTLGVYWCFCVLRGVTQSPGFRTIIQSQTYDLRFTDHRYRKLPCDVKLLPYAVRLAWAWISLHPELFLTFVYPRSEVEAHWELILPNLGASDGDNPSGTGGCAVTHFFGDCC